MAVKSNVLSVIARETSSATPQQLKDYALARANTVSAEDPDGMDWFAFCIDPRPDTKYFGLTFGDNIAESLGMSGNHYPLVDVTAASTGSQSAASVDMDAIKQLIAESVAPQVAAIGDITAALSENAQRIESATGAVAANSDQIDDNSTQLEQLQQLQALQSQLIETDDLEDEAREALLEKIQALHSQVSQSAESYAAQLAYLSQQNEAAKKAYQAQIAAIEKKSTASESDQQAVLQLLNQKIEQLTEQSASAMAQSADQIAEAEAVYQAKLAEQQQAFAASLAAEVAKQVAQIKSQLIAEASLQLSQSVDDTMTEDQIKNIVSDKVGELFTAQLPQFEQVFAESLAAKQGELEQFASAQIIEMKTLKDAYQASNDALVDLISSSSESITAQAQEVQQMMAAGKEMAAEIEAHHAQMDDVLVGVKLQLQANTVADAERLARLAEAEAKLTEDFGTLVVIKQQLADDKAGMDTAIDETKALIDALKDSVLTADEALKSSITRSQLETSALIDQVRLETESSSAAEQLLNVKSDLALMKDTLATLSQSVSSLSVGSDLSALVEANEINIRNLLVKVNDLAAKLDEAQTVEVKTQTTEAVAEEPMAEDPAGEEEMI